MLYITIIRGIKESQSHKLKNTEVYATSPNKDATINIECILTLAKKKEKN
jgi:hypothetical protein